MPDGHPPASRPDDEIPGIAGLDAARIRVLWEEGLASEALDGAAVVEELRQLFNTKR